MRYTVIIKQSAQKQIEKLPVTDREKVKNIILALQNNPRPQGSIKLTGTTNIYRVRKGNYRVVFEIIDRQLLVYVFDVDHRKDIYR